MTVITTTANGKEELAVIPGKEYLVEGVHVYYYARITKGHSNFSPTLLKKVLSICGFYDIVHIQSWWNLVTIPAALFCLIKGIRPIISLRGTLTRYTFSHRNASPKRFIHFLVGQRLLERSVLHVTSDREAMEVATYARNKQVYVIPNMLELPKATYNVKEDKPYLSLIFLGRIDPAKNLEMLFRILLEPFSFPFHLTVAGDGPADYVKQLKKQTRFKPEISWIGNVVGDKKFELLAKADLLVLPSHTENFGNVVIEALSQGTPVLISANVGAKDYVLQNNLGWVVEGSESEWHSSLQRIWNDSAGRAAIRSRAPACISRDFNRSEQVKAYISMYKQHSKNLSKV